MLPCKFIYGSLDISPTPLFSETVYFLCKCTQSRYIVETYYGRNLLCFIYWCYTRMVVQVNYNAKIPIAQS